MPTEPRGTDPPWMLHTKEEGLVARAQEGTTLQGGEGHSRRRGIRNTNWRPETGGTDCRRQGGTRKRGSPKGGGTKAPAQVM